MALQYGPFTDNLDDFQAFVNTVIDKLDPHGVQERAEAMNLAALLVRRSRLVEFEAIALAHATTTKMLPPVHDGGPARIAQDDFLRVGADALSANLFATLPRYESPVQRADRAYARYARMQEAR